MTQALLDEDILILEELEQERACESPRHDSRMMGHGPGPLFFIIFHCKCARLGVTIRCKPWMDSNWARDHWVCGMCEQGVETKDWYTVIGPVE